MALAGRKKKGKPFDFAFRYLDTDDTDDTELPWRAR